ncbi:hypothetical protein LIER_13230 [Lithospermum erythrorhizon]|uniref:Uncharacterized protein n=1 Tax=Lithospermum erythrorhizon TaxID=34254 RepID=A0AAV3PWA5_LITER
MLGIDPKVVLHKLYVDPTFQPIKQKKQVFNDEKSKAIREETKGKSIKSEPQEVFLWRCIGEVLGIYD